MRLLYDEDLVEAVVLLCAAVGTSRRAVGGNGVPPAQIRRFHAEREKVYSILDPDARHQAFFKLHSEWFREWGMEQQLSSILQQFALLGSRLAAVGFRKARNKSEEGADLYVNADGLRHGVVALLPERFGKENGLRPFLNHELMHVSDMVDPVFAYSREIHQPHQTESQRRLIRQRYRLLWDVAIDGRLNAAGRVTVATMEQRRGEFDRAFSFLSAHRRDETFARLWNGAPTHDELLALASDPRELNGSEAQIPGAPCPLCGFATFHWANVPALTPETLARVSCAFPEWRAEFGACSRCIEIYECTAHLELPPTVCL